MNVAVTASLLVLPFVSFAYFNGGPYQFGKQNRFCSDCALSVLPWFYRLQHIDSRDRQWQFSQINDDDDDDDFLQCICVGLMQYINADNADIIKEISVI